MPLDSYNVRTVIMFKTFEGKLQPLAKFCYKGKQKLSTIRYREIDTLDILILETYCLLRPGLSISKVP